MRSVTGCLTAALTLAGLFHAVAAPGADGRTGQAQEEKAVVIRVNGEEFTREALRHTGPLLAGEHVKAYLPAYVRRFVDYRLVLQEARRRGIEEGEEFQRRMKIYTDFRAADALIAEVAPAAPMVGEEEIDEYAAREGVGRDEARSALSDLKLHETLEKHLAASGVEVPVSRAEELPALLGPGADRSAVVARAGREEITSADLLQALGTEAGKASPAQIDEALDRLVLERRLIVVAREKGYGPGPGDSVAAAAFREKLLEKIFLEEVEASLTVTDEEVRAAQEGAPIGVDVEQVRSRLMNDRLRKTVRAMIAEWRSRADIWIADGLVQKE